MSYFFGLDIDDVASVNCKPWAAKRHERLSLIFIAGFAGEVTYRPPHRLVGHIILLGQFP